MWSGPVPTRKPTTPSRPYTSPKMMQNCRADPTDPFVPKYSDSAPDTRCIPLCALPRCAPRRLGLKKPTIPTAINTTPTRVATVFAMVSPYRVTELNSHDRPLITCEQRAERPGEKAVEL